MITSCRCLLSQSFSVKALSVCAENGSRSTLCIFACSWRASAAAAYNDIFYREFNDRRGWFLVFFHSVSSLVA